MLADTAKSAPVTLTPNPTRRPDDRVRAQFDPAAAPGDRGGKGRQPLSTAAADERP